MVEICKKELCTGCAACINKCPKSCINMSLGKLGHLYPHIDKNLCIDCGACRRVCPVNYPLELLSPQVAYAGWSKDVVEYQTSTSGGFASAISRKILSQGGVVYGCTCFEDVDVQHVRIDEEADLYKLKGSKYVQSNVGLIYRSIKVDLKEGLKVLFIGTPCQVAALRNYIGQYENLYLIDLICHGVPSLAYLKSHVRQVAKNAKISEVRFRDGNDMHLLLYSQGKIVYRKALWEKRYKDTYFNTFIDGYTYRDSCYTCRYAQSKRVSDITIGDFWGLKENLSEEHKYGCSCILPITEKGKHMVEAVSENFYLFEREINEAVNGNSQLRHPSRKTERIRMFYKLYPLLGISFSYRLMVIDKILKYYLKYYIKKMLRK